MQQYFVCQIAGRQYIVKPGEVFEVNRLSTEGEITVDKILMSVDNNKVEVGTPFLNKTLVFEVIETIKKPKVRVATYKSKANYRRVIGSRAQMTKIKLLQQEKSKKIQSSKIKTEGEK